MRKQFIEKNLHPSFRSKEVEQARKLINNSTSFTVIGLPNVGISTFLRFICSQTFAYFIHIDLYELDTLTKEGLFDKIAYEVKARSSSDSNTLVSIKKKLTELTQKNQRVVLVFDRFDQLKNSYSPVLFMNLTSLAEVDRSKIVCIFSANSPIPTNSFELFAHKLFVKPYSQKDLLSLTKLYSPQINFSSNMYKQSGGHLVLSQLLSKSGRTALFLEDDFIKLQLKRIYTTFSPKQQRTLQQVALEKPISNIDRYLLHIGIVTKRAGQYSLFSPLFTQYILSTAKKPLTKLETRLLQILKTHEGKIVTKEEIFEKLWASNPEKQSDWALNALVYRVRKKGEYNIQNQKKIGYILNTT